MNNVYQEFIVYKGEAYIVPFSVCDYYVWCSIHNALVLSGPIVGQLEVESEVYNG